MFRQARIWIVLELEFTIRGKFLNPILLSRSYIIYNYGLHIHFQDSILGNSLQFITRQTKYFNSTQTRTFVMLKRKIFNNLNIWFYKMRHFNSVSRMKRNLRNNWHSFRYLAENQVVWVDADKYLMEYNILLL